jgi:rare lipoprotein A
MPMRRTVALGLAAALCAGAWAGPQAPHPRHAQNPKDAQVGKASIYAKKFANRRMADGRRMDPNGDNAASKTLPLGTKALVTHLGTGKSAVVTIEDRGPHVPGRIVDLSPATAEQIGLSRKEGLARVEVRPLDVPPG